MATITESLSAFPNGVDQFNELFDLPYDKYEKADRLTKLKMQRTLSNDEQNELLQLSAELLPFLITPATFNKFASALYSVEKFFKDNVQGFIESKQKIWDSYVKNFVYVGAWTAGKAYKLQNLVSDSNGDLYLCKKEHTSTSDITLRNTNYWAKASAKGDKGDIGLNAVFKGDWIGTTNYVLGDAVCHINTGVDGGLIYVARRNNVGKNPATSPDDWVLLTKIVSGTTKPLGASKGTHYIEVID